MAGSKKYYIYTTDKGTDFALNIDKSNTEAVNAGTQEYTTASGVIYTLPSNVRPRYAVYSNATKTRNIKCYALTETIFNGLVAGVPTIPDPLTPANTLSLTHIEPEKLKRLPVAIDTGLTDP